MENNKFMKLYYRYYDDEVSLNSPGRLLFETITFTTDDGATYLAGKKKVSSSYKTTLLYTYTSLFLFLLNFLCT